MEEKSWHKSYAPGVPPTLAYDQTTVSRALSRSAKNFPNHSALNYMGHIISYKKLDSMVNAFARVLTGMGIKANDKVAVCLPNIPQAIIANYAIFRIGAVAVLCNPLYTERELAYQLNDSDSKIIVTLTLLVPRIEKIQTQTKIEKIIACHIHSYLPFPKKQLFPYVRKTMYKKITPTENVKIFKDLMRGQPDGPVDDPVKDLSQWEEVGALLYTGGTTGVSKGSYAHPLEHELQCSTVYLLVPGFKKRRRKSGGQFSGVSFGRFYSHPEFFPLAGL